MITRVTRLSTVLGVVWPGDRAVVDADTAGGDTPFRLWTQDREQRLAPSPSIAQLAAAARLGLSPTGPLPFAQRCSLVVPVVPGMLSADRALPLGGLWPKLAAEAPAWSGTVIADRGRLQTGNPAMPMAAAAEPVLVVTRADLERLARPRERVTELAHRRQPGPRPDTGRGGGDRAGAPPRVRRAAGAVVDRVAGAGRRVPGRWRSARCPRGPDAPLFSSSLTAARAWVSGGGPRDLPVPSCRAGAARTGRPDRPEAARRGIGP